MQIRREPFVFFATVAVTGALGYLLFSAMENPVVRPQLGRKDREVPAARIPDIAKIPTPLQPGANESRRDLFAAPRDSRPLPRLRLVDDLAPPEPDSYSILSPPTWPAPAIRHWHLYYRVPGTITRVEWDAPADGEAGAATGDNIASPDPAVPPGNPEAAKPAVPDDATLAMRYDRVTPVQGFPNWGQIKNPRKYEIKDGEPIIFQIYDVKENKPFGSEITYKREDIQSYQLAKTLRNEIEMRKRKVIWAAGNESKIREFGLWCLVRGDEDSFALEEAGRQLEKAIELAPKDPANVLAFGQYLEAMYRFEDAWKLYRTSTEGDFRSEPGIWVARAGLESRLYLVHDSRTSLETAARLNGNDYMVRLALGEFHLSRGAHAEARDQLDAAYRNEPTGLDAAAVRARIRRGLGEALLSLGAVDQASEMFEKARVADPSDGLSITAAAVVLMLKKQDASALELLNSTIERPTSGGESRAVALVARGLLKIQRKDYAAARADFEGAIGLDPLHDVRPLTALAFLYYITDHRDDAQAAIERALLNDPGDPYAHYLRGRMRRDAADRSGAREDQKEALMTELGFVEPLVELGLLAMEEKLFDAADRYYSKATEFDANNPDIAALRGLSLLLGNQRRAARDCFVASLGHRKDHPLAHLGLGLAHYLDDNPTGMLTEMAQVRDGRPEGDKFREYAVQTLRLIDIHERKEEWTDTFDRMVLSSYFDNPPLHPRGVEVKPVSGEARISGLYEDAGTASINCNKFRLADFCSFEAAVRVPGATSEENKADVITYIRKIEQRSGGTAQVSFEIALIREWKADGTVPVKVRYKFLENAPLPREVLFTWPSDRTVTVRIEVNDDETRPRGRLLLDGQVVEKDIEFPRSSAGAIDLGVEVTGNQGNRASVSIESVRVVRRTQS